MKRSIKDKVKKRIILPIEEVEIGLITAEKRVRYSDTDNLVEDLDYAYKVTIPGTIEDEEYYFEDKDNAQKFYLDFLAEHR